MLIDIAGFTDERGLKIAISGMKLIIPKELQFIAERVLNSNYFNRAPIKTAMEGDFDTGNMRFKARERYSFGVSDWRTVFGTPGAA